MEFDYQPHSASDSLGSRIRWNMEFDYQPCSASESLGSRIGWNMEFDYQPYSASQSLIPRREARGAIHRLKSRALVFAEMTLIFELQSSREVHEPGKMQYYRLSLSNFILDACFTWFFRENPFCFFTNRARTPPRWKNANLVQIWSK